MFADESGRLANVPSVEILRRAMRKGNGRSAEQCGQGRAAAKSLIDQITEAVRGRLTEAGLSRTEDDARRYILQEFARTGMPPSAAAIAGALKLPSADAAEKIVEKLSKADILTCEGREIVSAYPFSAQATRHTVIFRDGHAVYALCATDALGIHFMLREDITVRSRCPECEREMTIDVKDGAVVSAVPDGMVEFVGKQEHCGCTAKTFCPFMNFFCSREHLEKWRERNPANGTGEMYHLHEVLQHGKHIFGDFLK
jgi:hypothetical protein